MRVRVHVCVRLLGVGESGRIRDFSSVLRVSRTTSSDSLAQQSWWYLMGHGVLGITMGSTHAIHELLSFEIYPVPIKIFQHISTECKNKLRAKSNSIAGKASALHPTNLSLIPSIPCQELQSQE